MTWRPPYRLLPYAVCLLACMAVDLFYFPPTTIFPDEHRFLAEAARLVATGQFWTAHDRAWEMPGTALFFAPAVWLLGPHAAVTVIRLVQALLLVLQCALIGFIARRIFGSRLIGFVASCIAAVYPFLIYYQGLLLSETLFDTLLLAGVAALYQWRGRAMRIDAAIVVASLCFTMATLTKATLTVLPPVLFAATAWMAGAGLRRTVAILLAASCLYGAGMSPWWIRNAVVLHAFVPFTTSSGANLYLGNNSHNPNAGIDWAHDVDPAVVAKIRALPDELTRQRAFKDAALDYIAAHPGAFVRAAAKKFVRLWNVVPNAAEFRGGLYAAISVLSYGPVLLLALICVVRGRRQWRLLAPIWLIVGYFTFVHVVTIASLRYRLPLEPLLIVLAAEPLAIVLQRMRTRWTSRSVPADNTSPY